MILTLKKLNQQGFDHIIVLAFVVLVVGVTGTFILTRAHAATPTTPSTSTSPPPVGVYDGADICDASGESLSKAFCLYDTGGPTTTNAKVDVYARKDVFPAEYFYMYDTNRAVTDSWPFTVGGGNNGHFKGDEVYQLFDYALSGDQQLCANSSTDVFLKTRSGTSACYWVMSGNHLVNVAQTDANHNQRYYLQATTNTNLAPVELTRTYSSTSPEQAWGAGNSDVSSD